jgi:hypothetical protein
MTRPLTRIGCGIWVWPVVLVVPVVVEVGSPDRVGVPVDVPVPVDDVVDEVWLKAGTRRIAAAAREIPHFRH